MAIRINMESFCSILNSLTDENKLYRESVTLWLGTDLISLSASSYYCHRFMRYWPPTIHILLVTASLLCLAKALGHSVYLSVL